MAHAGPLPRAALLTPRLQNTTCLLLFGKWLELLGTFLGAKLYRRNAPTIKSSNSLWRSSTLADRDDHSDVTFSKSRRFIFSFSFFLLKVLLAHSPLSLSSESQQSHCTLSPVRRSNKNSPAANSIPSFSHSEGLSSVLSL